MSDFVDRFKFYEELDDIAAEPTRPPTAEEKRQVEALFDRLNTKDVIADLTKTIMNRSKYEGAFLPMNETHAERMERRLGLKVGARVQLYEAASIYEEQGLRVGDVGTVIRLESDGIEVSWDRLNREEPVCPEDVGPLGLLERLADESPDVSESTEN